MRAIFDARLVNEPFGDPGVYVDFRFERRALLFDLGDNAALPPRKLLRLTHVFVSHTHMDHFIGFDHLLRIFLARELHLDVFGPPGIIANVRGKLAADKTPFDLFVSAFPAGTVSGAPKIRAMQIISELEPQKRGLYAGAIGYFGYNGNLDTCIVIRTIVMKGKKVFINAGAGIVADSDPASEYQETLNKARAMLRAIELAEQWRKR